MMKSGWKLAIRCMIACAAGSCLVGWVAQTSQAQDAPQSSSSVVGAEKLTPLDGPVTQVEGAARSVQPAPGSIRSEPAASDVSPFDASTTATGVEPNLAAESGEEPEKCALAFAEGAQKLAEAQRRALKDEEVRLRARLQKVEAGIKRWDSVLAALKQSQGTTMEFSAMKPPARLGALGKADRESDGILSAPAGERTRRNP
jgi:hypothetical protein